MIIYDFDVVSLSIAPLEADAPLVVDANTALSSAVTTEFFKTIGRWNAQISEVLGVAKHAKLTVSNLLDIVRELSRVLTGKDLPGFWIPEGFDHDLAYNERR